MELLTELKVYRVEKQCPQCEPGRMVASGEAYLTNPLRYWHTCNKCGYFADYHERYPDIQYGDAKQEKGNGNSEKESGQPDGSSEASSDSQ